LKIELVKTIPIYKMTFIGEVDFFRDSPYSQLLENIESERELRNELEDRGLSEPAIKNVVQKLRDLKILKDGYIEKPKNGFPVKEYGKFSLEVFQNDTNKPFKNINRKINRENAFNHDIQNLRENSSFLNMVSNSSNPDFRVEVIENNKALLSRSGDSQLEIVYQNGWKYHLDDKNYSMEEIPFDEIFGSDWSSDYQSMKIDFETISDETAKESFEFSFDAELKIRSFGKFSGNFQNIPVMPKSIDDAKEWAISLLKDEIENKNRYISKEELKQLWNNLLDRKGKLRIFDLEFDYETILNKFGRDSKYFWLLQAGVDLFPFDRKKVVRDKVIIEANSNLNLEKDFFQEFNIKPPQSLIIVDRWIVNLQQFKGLEKVIEAFGNPETTIITQKVLDSQNNKLIEKIVERNRIRKLEKSKNEIVHQRYWIIDDKFYQTSESLDFLKVENDNVESKYITFELYSREDLDREVLRLMGEVK
jgi:hypothetical protein